MFALRKVRVDGFGTHFMNLEIFQDKRGQPMPVQQQILVVDDEEDILELLTFHLEKEGYGVRNATTGEEALKEVKRKKTDLVILDIMMPGMSGLELCRRFKKDPETESIPIVMLSAKGEEADIVTGLELGADDYITKPFRPRILLARIRSVLRRRTQVAEPEDTVKIHDLVIHPGRREVLLNSSPVDLTFSEFQILRFLASRPGWVFTRHQIIDAVHGDHCSVTDRSVDVQIVSLRKKLGESANYIETVRGVGYRFKELA
jgi:two-component system phosphate regulon response regulator PhoB